MATSIEVNKKSVAALLESAKNHKFVIPEYQRPYAWGDEECQTLWDDLSTFATQEGESTYFLGTIVSYENDKGESEIIDGQQRITTLFLLLRAIYTKLSNMQETPEVKNFKNKIEPCLWERDAYTGEVKFDRVLISSEVITDEANETFVSILKTGQTTEKAKDRYSINYQFFQRMADDYALRDPMQWYSFCLKILDSCILLPIECDTQDTALTIFSTLNDRGLPLSDADIFKAKIYNSLSKDQKNVFIENWKQLDVDAENAGVKIQDLFYYYMFYLRALDNDRDTTTPALRKYFARDSYSKLYDDRLMDNLHTLANLWAVINNREEIDGEKWTTSMRIKKVLDCLKSYKNEWWKYPTCLYYLSHRSEDGFEELFAVFLERLFAYLCAKQIVTPGISAIKTDIINLQARIVKTPAPTMPIFSDERLKDSLVSPHRNAVEMLLKVLAYAETDQRLLLPDHWEIEHILPRKWQTTSLYGEDFATVEPYIEMLGNKIPFEKKLNIQAGNRYFGVKKQKYVDSKIAIVQKLSEYTKDEWGRNDIAERNVRVADSIMERLTDWGLFDVQTDSATHDSAPYTPTKEELEQIEALKAKGLI